jgi:hypothetical protein
MVKKYRLLKRCIIAENSSPYVANTNETLTLSFPVHGTVIINGSNRITTQASGEGDYTVLVPQEFIKVSTVFSFQPDNDREYRLPRIFVVDIEQIPQYVELKDKYEALKAKGEMQ